MATNDQAAQGPAYPAPIEADGFPMGAGYQSSADPRRIALGKSQQMEHVKFETGAVRRDFGWDQVGDTAQSPILGIGEHAVFEPSGVQGVPGKFVRYVYRLIRRGGKCVVQVVQGDAWVDRVTSLDDLADVRFVSHVSLQGALCVADGVNPIMVWSVVPVFVDESLPFAGPVLAFEGDSDQVVIVGTATAETTYTMTYNLDLSAIVAVPPANGATVDIIVEMTRNGTTILGSKTHTFDAQTLPSSLVGETIAFDGVLQDGDTVEVTLKSVIASVFPTGFQPITGGSYSVDPPTAVGVPTQQSNGDNLLTYGAIVELQHTLTPNVGEDTSQGIIDVEVFYAVNVAGWGPWIAIPSQDFSIDLTGAEPFVDWVTYRARMVEPGIFDTFDFVRFGFRFTTAGTINNVTSNDTGGAELQSRLDYTTQSVGTVALDPLTLDYRYEDAPLDDMKWITVINFPQLEVDAPTARYLGKFGDRLFALWNEGDSQYLGASSDGDILMWSRSTGVPHTTLPDDSVSLFLIDTRVDVVDDLIWIHPVSSQVAILGRRRSLMRVFETGNVALAVGATHWLDGIGTEFPWGLTQVEKGVMFLGHDRMVYYMTADQVIPVGRDIQEDLIKSLYTNSDYVDCMFDTAFQEFTIGIPEDGAFVHTRWYIFDLGHFLRTQEMIWRTRTAISTRLVQINQIKIGSPTRVAGTG